MQKPQGDLQADFQGHLQGRGIAIGPADRNDAHHSVVTDLVALIEHAQASLRLIEREIARETACDGQATSSHVIELDDVTPPYVGAAKALRSCNATLAIALHALLDSKMPERGSNDHVWNPPVRLIVNA